LPHVRYAHIARAIEGGQHWVGLSDFTALQLALLARTGARSWQGPALGEDFGAEGEPDDIMAACFEDLCEGRGEGAGWRVPAKAVAAHVGSAPLRIRNATLWGGNLCMVCSLLGTPYWPDVRKGVLFLEDVGEHPYRIERMLTQMLHAGALQQQRAIVLGQFTNYRTVPHDKGYRLATVVQWLRAQLPAKVAIIEGLPFGHVPTKVLLPVGAKVDLLLEDRDAMLLWGHA
jgi:muramoyltetrapeptide carboxypeptidase